MSSKSRLLAGCSALAFAIVLAQPAAAGCPASGTLSLACPAPIVPTGSLTITSTGSVISDDTTDAINNTSSIALLSNAGAITSAGGSGISNSSLITTLDNSGTISGVKAINNTSVITTLTNSGTISGSTYALYNTGSVSSINLSGTIAGNIYSTNVLTITGSTIPGTVGTLTGYNGTVGTITGNTLRFTTGALLLNDNISGSTSVQVTGMGGSLTNTGTLSGSGRGIALTSGVGLASVTNSGTISGATAYGLANDGAITAIDNSGSISGGIGGIATDGTIGTITNSGTISNSKYGIYNLYSGISLPGTITTINNTGTISGTLDAIYNTGAIGTINNSGTISGKINSTTPLTINGGSGSTFGTLSGGTLTVAGLTFASGNLNLNDDIAAGSSTVSNSGATLKLSSPISITGKYAQSAGLLDLGSAGQMTVSDAATFTGGTVAFSLSNSGNYMVGSNTTLIGAATGSSYTGVTVALTGITGLSASADTSSTTNLVAAYLNDYIGGNLASLTNGGALGGAAYGVYVAATGTLGSLTNTGTLGGNTYAIYNLGSLGTITNSGTIAGNIASANALTINGGGTAGTLSGGTITAPGLTFASGNLNLADAINVGSGTVSNTGATLILASSVSVTGNYTQTSGVLDLGASGHLTVSGTANITGGTVAVSTGGGNYVAGGTVTLITAASGSSYSGVTLNLTGVTGLSASADTTSTTNLVATYLNDYVSGNLASISNTGALSGSAYAVYVASTGTLGALTNTGTISGSQYDIYIAGTVTSLTNSNHIGSPYGVYVASTGTLTSLSNSGTISGDTYAIYSAGILGPITNSGTIAGNIFSSGNLSFAGGATSGTLSGGTISAPGVTFVSGHTSLADNINVGTGTVSNTGATLELASKVTITGNYVQTGGALISDVASTTSYGSLVVSGSATVSGASITLSGAAVKAGQTYTIIDAGGASTYTNNTVTVVGAHYKTVLTISGDDLLASIKPMFADVGAATGGDAAVLGTVFDNLSGVTAMQTSITTLSALSDANLGKALLQAAPAQVSSGAAMLQRADMMNGLIIDAVDQRSTAGAGWSLWGQVMGGAANRAAVSGAEGYKTTALGMIVGADTRVNAAFVVGGAFSWSQGWNSGESDLSGNTNRVSSYQLTGYTSWQQGALTVSGQAGVGFNNYAQRRVMSALGEVANADYSGRQYMMASEGTYSLPLDGALGGATLTPTVSLRWLHLDTDGYSETGAGSDGLRVGASAVDQVQSGLGAKLSWAVDTSAGRLVPALKVLWVHDFIDGATATDANLGGLGFSTAIGRVASDGAKVGAGVTFYRADAVSLTAEYSGDFRNDYTAHTGRIEVRIAL